MRAIRGWMTACVACAVLTADAQQNLAGTNALVFEGDPAAQMVEGIHAFLDRETQLSLERRSAHTAPPDRETFRRIINEWVWKVTRTDSRYSYMLTPEYDMLEFNFANVVNYSDLANLMAPRPFMVERGHYDGVAPDEWVAYEFAKVRQFYTKMGIADRAEIEFFDGPHRIHGVGTFEFLRRHLHSRN